jgi:hypothetical protein
MSRKVIVANRSVYHKYATIEIEIPDTIEEDKVDDWLFKNSEQWEEKLDQKIADAEYVFGFGLGNGLIDAKVESETRYDLFKTIDICEVEYICIYGGHL